MPIGELRDEPENTWVFNRRPRGDTNFPPQGLLGGERVEVGGGGAEGGEGEAVEAGEDVSFDDVSRDGGDHGGAACIGGGGGHFDF